MEKRKFTREFKLETVRLIKARGRVVCAGLAGSQCAQAQLRSWVKALADVPQHAFSATDR
jgi:transposase